MIWTCFMLFCLLVLLFSETDYSKTSFFSSFSEQNGTVDRGIESLKLKVPGEQCLSILPKAGQKIS